MKVVLLSDVRKVGRKYDVVEASDGYALNFLIPQKKAVIADAKKILWAEQTRKNSISEKDIQADLLGKNMDDISKAVVTIAQKVNDKGHLFAGLHKEDIAIELEKQTGLSINPDFIVLDKHIKEVGEHMIKMVAGDKKASFKLVVEELK
jgi:large subunit ribosomal protein L9